MYSRAPDRLETACRHPVPNPRCPARIYVGPTNPENHVESTILYMGRGELGSKFGPLGVPDFLLGLLGGGDHTLGLLQFRFGLHHLGPVLREVLYIFHTFHLRCVQADRESWFTVHWFENMNWTRVDLWFAMMDD
jgi:hypothetical protein